GGAARAGRSWWRERTASGVWWTRCLPGSGVPRHLPVATPSPYDRRPRRGRAAGPAPGRPVGADEPVMRGFSASRRAATGALAWGHPALAGVLGPTRQVLSGRWNDHDPHDPPS